MLLKGNIPLKINSYGKIMPRNYISYIFEFQIVPFALSLILGDPFMVSLLPLTYGEGGIFPNVFHRGQVLRGKIIGGLLYMGELMIRSYEGGRSFTKYIFQ